MTIRLAVPVLISLLLSGCMIESEYVYEQEISAEDKARGATIQSVIRYGNFKVDEQNMTVTWVQRNTHEKFVEEKRSVDSFVIPPPNSVKFTGTTYDYSSIIVETHCTIVNLNNWECPGFRMIDGELTQEWFPSSRKFKKRYRLASF